MGDNQFHVRSFKKDTVSAQKRLHMHVRWSETNKLTENQMGTNWEVAEKLQKGAW